MRQIKELRIGEPKTRKTDAVCSTYPRPLLLLNFDPFGPDVLKAGDQVATSDLPALVNGTEALQDKIYVCDFASVAPRILASQYRGKENIGLKFIQSVNTLFAKNPFKTVVLDSWSGMDPVINIFIQNLSNKEEMTLPLWGLAGTKKEEILQAILSLACNVVVICHTEGKKDEVTGEIRIVPYGSGKFPERMGALFSQVFAARAGTDSKGQPEFKVLTCSQGLYKGLGARWPQGLPPVCGPFFNDIYSKETP